MKMIIYATLLISAMSSAKAVETIYAEDMNSYRLPPRYLPPKEDAQIRQVDYRTPEFDQSFLVVGPFKAVEGELEIGDDNLPKIPGQPLVGKDTGKTLKLKLKGVYSNGQNQLLSISMSSDLFTKRVGTARERLGKKVVGIYSTEVNRVSIRKIQLDDGGIYYIAGVGAENITNNGAISRVIQKAFHNENKLVSTKKTFEYMTGKGPQGISGDASVGVGKESSIQVGDLELFADVQAVAQVSTADRNTHVEVSGAAGAKLGGTQVSGYAGYSASPEEDARWVGVRVDQDITDRTKLSFAVEKRKDFYDSLYGAENKMNNNTYFKFSWTKKFGGGGAPPSRAADSMMGTQ